jgi:hypothetical protein
VRRRRRKRRIRRRRSLFKATAGGEGNYCFRRTDWGKEESGSRGEERALESCNKYALSPWPMASITDRVYPNKR